jgi:Zn-dependent peptidase ImmA (M78 family)
VPIASVALKMSVKVYVSSDMGASRGRLDVGVDSTSITVPKDTDLSMQRFIIAHEIGHLLRHNWYKLSDRWEHEDTTFKDKNHSGHRPEWEANCYAAGLLMPIGLVSIYAHAVDYDVAKVARQFNVSVPAMRVRFKRLSGADDGWGWQ